MNKTVKTVLPVVGVSLATSLLSVWGVAQYNQSKDAGMQDASTVPFNYASFKEGNNNTSENGGGPVDFTAAAKAAVPAVVHIKILTKAQKVQSQASPFGDLFGDDNPFGQLFGGGSGGTQVIPGQRASGSGVIISQDGYIVTNNHVVSNAKEVTVTLANKKEYKAKVVGTDPNSDLAVIKIEATNLPYLTYGNSNDVQLGQWVLAIGYPLNLDATVTAGIVSAKSRSIGLNKGDAPVDSYIQTDAAVNPGNSGGALVNTNGQLIGINSAIASPTGSYAGYSYAIPVNIVKKTVTDLIKYGAVQRGYLGIQYLSDEAMNSDKARKQFNIPDNIDGIYVSAVTMDGAAKAAGIQKGDIITSVDGQNVNSGADLTGIVGDHKPGDKLSVKYNRAGKSYTTTVTLKGNSGQLASASGSNSIEGLGGNFEALTLDQAHKLNLRGGVMVKELGDGPLSKTYMQEGFIITNINDKAVTKIDDIKKIISSSDGTLRIKGIYPNDLYVHGYRIDLNNSSDSDSNDDNN